MGSCTQAFARPQEPASLVSVLRSFFILAGAKNTGSELRPGQTGSSPKWFLLSL